MLIFHINELKKNLGSRFYLDRRFSQFSLAEVWEWGGALGLIARIDPNGYGEC